MIELDMAMGDIAWSFHSFKEILGKTSQSRWSSASIVDIQDSRTSHESLNAIRSKDLDD